jgi:hypothetical protein
VRVVSLDVSTLSYRRSILSVTGREKTELQSKKEKTRKPPCFVQITSSHVTNRTEEEVKCRALSCRMTAAPPFYCFQFNRSGIFPVIYHVTDGFFNNTVSATGSIAVE